MAHAVIAKCQGLARTACQNNNTALIAQVFILSAQLSNSEKVSITNFCVEEAIRAKSVNVLEYLVAQGVDFKGISPSQISCRGQESFAILEILLAHGWDINARAPGAMPFMWCVVKDEDAVRWCLKHGANVQARDQEPLRNDVVTADQQKCPTILERAASYGTVATFELLRAEGAPLGWRPLHLAVWTATWPYNDRPEYVRHLPGGTEKMNDNVDRAHTYAERMAMVRYLVDVVGLDVNAHDQPPGSWYGGSMCGNSLCYVEGGETVGRVGGKEYNIDLRELTWFLLDRDADPTEALRRASDSKFPIGNPEFVQAVNEWKARQAMQASGKWTGLKAAMESGLGVVWRLLVSTFRRS